MLIVNVHGLPYNHPMIVYVGRETGRFVGKKFIGWNASPLGNPIRRGRECPVCKGTHKTDVSTLPCYSKHLLTLIKKRDEDVLAALRQISETSILGCWCCNADEGRPADRRVCHAEIVASAWRWTKKEGLLDEIIEQNLVSVPTE